MAEPGVDSDPIQRYLNAAEHASGQGVDTAPASLATAGQSRRPSVRIVLLRQVDSRGFVFFTNYGSRKAREVTENRWAALCQHWPTLEEQIRVEGTVEIIDPAESDRYFSGRPRDSQLGAWASDQSNDMHSRDLLVTRYAEVEATYQGRPVPRPPFWGGFRIVPERIEFWSGRPGRLHDRLLYTRTDNAWTSGYLFP